MLKQHDLKKLKLVNTVSISNLPAEDKCMLIELLMRSDENWYSFPAVERLCQARGMKYEKNFKGADKYLPDFVTISQRGRGNGYTLDPEAIAALEPMRVIIKHTKNTPVRADSTPSSTDNTPSSTDNTPSSTDNTPSTTDEESATAGAYSTKEHSPRDSTEDSSLDSSKVDVAVAEGGSNNCSSNLLIKKMQERTQDKVRSTFAAKAAGTEQSSNIKSSPSPLEDQPTYPTDSNTPIREDEVLLMEKSLAWDSICLRIRKEADRKKGSTITRYFTAIDPAYDLAINPIFRPEDLNPATRYAYAFAQVKSDMNLDASQSISGCLPR